MLVGIGDGLLEPHNPTETARIVSGIDGTASSDDVLARQFGNYARRTDNDPLALRAALLRPRPNPPTQPDLQKIEATVTLVVGDRDFVLPVDRLVRSFKECKLVILKNCDHFASTENFGFIDALLEFFCAP